MKILILTMLLVGCSPDHTPDEAITVCHKVCGERPLDSFDYKGDEGAVCHAGDACIDPRQTTQRNG